MKSYDELSRQLERIQMHAIAIVWRDAAKARRMSLRVLRASRIADAISGTRIGTCRWNAAYADQLDVAARSGRRVQS